LEGFEFSRSINNQSETTQRNEYRNELALVIKLERSRGTWGGDAGTVMVPPLIQGIFSSLKKKSPGTYTVFIL